VFPKLTSTGEKESIPITGNHSTIKYNFSRKISPKRTPFLVKKIDPLFLLKEEGKLIPQPTISPVPNISEL
jgi:hypothetical protein